MQGGARDDNDNRGSLGITVDCIDSGDMHGLSWRCRETMINTDTINAMFDEILALRRANTVLLDRLHQCKRRNREDKVRLRNTKKVLESTVKCWYNAYRLLEEESGR